MLNESFHSRKVQLDHIRPVAQLAQLAEGFADVRVFSQPAGAEIKDEVELKRTDSPWLYYLCRIKPQH